MNELRLREVLGTLTHNRPLASWSEVTQYTRFDTQPLDGRAVARWLRRRGFVRRVDTSWDLTTAGWNWLRGE